MDSSTHKEKILTISIAAYNCEKYIRKALGSVIDENSIDDLEVFVVDDGGTDSTLQIAEEYANQYPNSIFPIHKENGGYGSVVNYSIAHATGKYFKLLDGDDWFDIEGLKSHLRDLKTFDVDMVITPKVKFYEGEGKVQIQDNMLNAEMGEYDVEDLDILEYINMHLITYRTQMLKCMNLRITENCFYTDTEFALFPLPYVKRIYVSHIPVYCYRVGLTDQSTSYIGRRKHFLDHLKVVESVFDLYFGINDKEKKYAKWIYSKLISLIAGQYHYLCVLQMSMSNLKRLKDFDGQIRSNGIIYNDTSKLSRFVRLLRKSHFLLYPICYIWEKRLSKSIFK